MTDLERAEVYIRIFIGAGERWWYYVPVDADVRGDAVQFGNVTMTDQRDGTWTLAAPGQKTRRYRKVLEETSHAR